MAVVGAVVALQALWLVPEEAEEKEVAMGTGWSALGLGGTRGAESAEEDVTTWEGARAVFCRAVWEVEWLETLTRVGRLLPVPAGAVLGGVLGLLALSLAAQFARVGDPLGVQAVVVEWVVHVALLATVGATYLVLLSVFLALRRGEGRRATILAMVVVARAVFPLLCPLFCQEGGMEWARAAWGALRRFV